jgi:uncharacterized membrane protein
MIMFNNIFILIILLIFIMSDTIYTKVIKSYNKYWQLQTRRPTISTMVYH